MADLRTLALTKVSSTLVDMKVTTKQTLFTVPTGKTFIPEMVVFRAATASLAGAVDSDLGGNVTLADDWIQQITLNAMTAVTDQACVMQPDQAAGPPIVPVKKIIYAAGIAFGIKVNTVSTGVASVYVDVFGYLY